MNQIRGYGFEPQPLKLEPKEEMELNLRKALLSARGKKQKAQMAHALNLLKARGLEAAATYLREKGYT